MRNYNWLVFPALVVATAAAIQACGSGSGPGNAPMVLAPAVTACSNYGCSSLMPQEKQASFGTCLADGGTYIPLNGAQICRIEILLPWAGMTIVPFPQLSTSNANNPRAEATNIHLFSGDKVTLMASGRQGKGFFKCSGPDVKGLDDGVLVNGADGQPAGLYGVLQTASGRSAAFLIGEKYLLGKVASDSILMVGWNPQADEKTSCIYMPYLQAEITRCVDVAGNSYQCPY
jgi:hypothetical protein